MTAEVRNVRTPAEQELAAHFERALPMLPGGARVRAVREKAFARFARTGLPTRRVEEWKYTDLRALIRNAAPPAKRPTLEEAGRALGETADPLAGLERLRLVLVDGYFFPELSDVAALEGEGVEFASLADLLAPDDAMSEHLLTHAMLASDDIALSINTAFAADGVAIRVAAGVTVSKPVEIVHLTTTGAAAARHALDVGENASLRLIETHRGAAGAAYQTNTVLGGMIGRGATVAFAKLQADARDALHIGTTMLGIGDGATFNHLGVAAGAAVSRSQLFVSTGGLRTQVRFSGATMIGGREHADNTLVIEHTGAGAFTRVLYKSVIDGEAEGVFQGKITVDPQAQKTDAKMMSRALLLSPVAQFAAKPELEIFADDVQCGHGATSGQIDEEQLFYLMARGVPKAVAERLLIEAFLDDAIDTLGDEAIGEALKRTVSAWLDARGSAS